MGVIITFSLCQPRMCGRVCALSLSLFTDHALPRYKRVSHLKLACYATLRFVRWLALLPRLSYFALSLKSNVELFLDFIQFLHYVNNVDNVSAYWLLNRKFSICDRRHIFIEPCCCIQIARCTLYCMMLPRLREIARPLRNSAVNQNVRLFFRCFREPLSRFLLISCIITADIFVDNLCDFHFSLIGFVRLSRTSRSKTRRRKMVMLAST